MSTFGGPKDDGMKADEGLALFSSEQEMQHYGLSDFLLSQSQAGFAGLGRRLNPERHYIACRWRHEDYEWLRRNEVWVEAKGQRLPARAVDWGPNTSTKRVADLSPGLAHALGLKTDQICKVTAGVEGGKPDFQFAPPAAAPAGTASLKTPDGRAEITHLFGDPANQDGTLNEHWEAQNIRRVAPPAGWQLYYQDDHAGLVPVSGIRMHRLVEGSFREVLQAVWSAARQQLGGSPSDSQIREWLHTRGLDQHGGGFNFRKIKDTDHFSLHAYGIAIDWDPDHNPRGKNLHFRLPEWWYAIWRNHGWSDGRHFPTPDPMHLQFATGA